MFYLFIMTCFSYVLICQFIVMSVMSVCLLCLLCFFLMLNYRFIYLFVCLFVCLLVML